jgi:DNA primase
MIAAADIAGVRDRARIDELISEHVTLRNAGGGSLKGLCPFHEERSPSFHVTPAKGLYYCFGCGQGGDAIDFLMALEHLTFSEAVEKLAARVGVTLRYEGGSAGRRAEQGRRTALLAVNVAAARWFAEQLATPAGAAARDFLTGRGFAADSWPQFAVGYAPRSGLVAHLRSIGCDERAIVESGVAGRGEGRLYDRFRDRVVWPIHDLSGDVVGFGARRLADDAGPKYLNTPETLVYKKSNVLFGAYEARRDIARTQQVVVVEGYTDVMACHLAGVTTAVATCGTSFGEGHVKLLRRLLLDDGGAAVTFTFDGDAAGRTAALRAYGEDQQFAAMTYVAVARDGKDPCDLRVTEGDEAVRNLVAARIPLFEFVLRTTIADLDLRTAEGRAAGIRATAPVIAGIKDPTLRPEYVRQVAGWLGVDAAEIHRLLPSPGRPGRGSRRPVSPPAGAEGRALQWQALQVLLQVPELVGPWRDSLEVGTFADPDAQSVYSAILAAGDDGLGGPVWMQSVIDNCRDDEERRRVRALVSRPLPADPVSPAFAIGIIAHLLYSAAGRRAEDLRAALGAPDLADDHVRSMAILADLQELEMYRRSLRQHWAPEA